MARDGALPVNTHGGFLSEGYVHGMNNSPKQWTSCGGRPASVRSPDKVALVTGQPGYITGMSSAVMFTSPMNPTIPPFPDADSGPFWDATRRHELQVQRCRVCDRLLFPARPACDLCGHGELDWVTSRSRHGAQLGGDPSGLQQFVHSRPFPSPRCSCSWRRRPTCSCTGTGPSEGGPRSGGADSVPSAGGGPSVCPAAGSGRGRGLRGSR